MNSINGKTFSILVKLSIYCTLWLPFIASHLYNFGKKRNRIENVSLAWISIHSLLQNTFFLTCSGRQIQGWEGSFCYLVKKQIELSHIPPSTFSYDSNWKGRYHQGVSLFLFYWYIIVLVHLCLNKLLFLNFNCLSALFTVCAL